MKNLIRTISLFTIVFSLNTKLSHAAPILSFDASESNVVKNVELNENFTIDLWLSNLDPSEDVGGFDIDFSVSSDVFDANIFDIVQAPGLDEFDILQLTLDNVSNFSGVSFAFDLSFQADAFALLSVEFMTRNYGTTTINIDNAMLSDAFGMPLDFEAFSATVNVLRPINNVNSPTIFLLFLAGLSLFSLRRK